ncbi:predicted protein [Naegleria gruberi]|uniref:Predicted protein n=1 Tax=Naegleria gruberi TaxID=5762 RepID=D2VDN0_NAEGR|nr:uncharacterized protein NAEGRDRAFT_48696 [Naegleria gruberi]EFC45030.1 predicted protein [Naegleria gruberi]|eukprot:XP_002677774.1 predicted protein [Naegleria gruberi strain NEG-M]
MHSTTSTSVREGDDRNVQLSLQRLRTENDTYQRNFDNLKREYLDLYNQNNEQHLRWKNQLEKKTKEFESLRNQFDRDTQELQQMKMKLMEELELRHRLEREIDENDKFREMYSDLRREYELTKNELTQKLKMAEKRFDEMKGDYEDRVQELIMQLNDQNIQMKTSKEILQVKRLEEEKEEMSISIKKLLSELHEVREEKAQAVSSREQSNLMNNQKHAELVSKVRTAETQHERLQKKCERLQAELEEITRSNDKMHDQILKLEKELTTTKSKLDETEKQFASERTSYKANQLQREREYERDRNIWANKVSELNKRVEDLQQAKQELVTQSYEIHIKENERLHEALRKETEKYLQLEVEKNELKQDLLSKEKRSQHDVQELTNEIARLRKESESVRAEAQAFREERDYQLDKNNHLLKVIADIKLDMDTLKHKHTDSNVRVEKLLKDLLAAKEIAKRYAAKAKKIKEAYRSKVYSVQRQVEDLNEQLLQAETGMSSIQQASITEKQQLQRRIFELERERDRFKILSSQPQQHELIL